MMHNCTSTNGNTVFIASGRPFKPSIQAIKISFTPLFESSVHTFNQNLAPYKVLVNDIKYRIRELIRQCCDAQDIHIIRGHVSADHVHLYISYPPQLSITEIVKSIKGRTSRRIQEEFPQLGKKYWGQHFWSIGYAAFSAGDINDEVIKEYVKNHQDKDFGEFTVDS